MPFLEIQSERFHYECTGTGLPLIFQHGLGADIQQPLSFSTTLNGWRMVSMDCRGHGCTEAGIDTERLSFSQFAEDLAKLLDHLAIERAVFGGISMGAGVALALAIAHPERVAGLILIRPAWLDSPFPNNLRWFPHAARLLEAYPRNEAEDIFRQSSDYAELQAESAASARSLMGQFQRPRARERAVVLAVMPGSVPVSNLGLCRRVKVPTLVVVNERDPLHPAVMGEKLAATIPDATLRQITSKTESEILHRAELDHALSEFLGPLQRLLSPSFV